MKSVGACACCGEVRMLHGRRLDRRCYYRARKDGTLADYPRVVRTGEDFMADYRLLRGEGHTDRQIAERLGMKLTALRQARYRAQRREEAA